MQTKLTTANDAYRAARERLDERLNAINRLVREHAERQQIDRESWGHAGDLNHVVASLDHLIEFLAGTKEARA